MNVARFVPAPLASWERHLNRGVWFVHSLLAFIIAYYTTNGEVRPWIGHWLHDSSYLPDQKIDFADSEWWFYKKNIQRILVALGCHSLVFTLFLQSNTNALRLLAFLAQLGLHVYLTSIPCIVTCAALTIVTIALVIIFRQEAIAWVVCIAFVLKCSAIAPFSNNSFVYYLEFNMYAYTCLKIINVAIHLCRRKADSQTNHSIADIISYLLYLPFSITLIVLYEDFKKQLDNRKAANRWFYLTQSNLFFAIRLAFWFLVLDLLMHFIYVNAIYSSPDTLLIGMNSYQLMSISYVVGQYFHIKYVVIFGIPALFAKIDGMQPPPGPICVSRVSRYSRMWRHFDAGLYQFLKNQVYIPLMSSVAGWKAVVLRLVAMVNVFMIVLVWHGFDSQYIFWVSLSAFELMVEWTGGAIWETERFQQLRTSIGERWTRRLVSLGMLGTVIPGIFGVFCFLGKTGIGITVIRRVLLDGFVEFFSGGIHLINWLPSPGIIFIHMLTLGYFFNGYTLEYDLAAKQLKRD
ncbi:unnamed protein product, partial [Mesorhabditis spiculigera]